MNHKDSQSLLETVLCHNQVLLRHTDRLNKLEEQIEQLQTKKVEQTSTLPLEVGQVWRRRDFREVTITHRVDSNSEYPWRTDNASYTKTGKYSINIENHPLDLVDLVCLAAKDEQTSPKLRLVYMISDTLDSESLTEAKRVLDAVIRWSKREGYEKIVNLLTEETMK